LSSLRRLLPLSLLLCSSSRRPLPCGGRAACVAASTSTRQGASKFDTHHTVSRYLRRVRVEPPRSGPLYPFSRTYTTPLSPPPPLPLDPLRHQWSHHPHQLRSRVGNHDRFTGRRGSWAPLLLFHSFCPLRRAAVSYGRRLRAANLLHRCRYQDSTQRSADYRANACRLPPTTRRSWQTQGVR